MKIDERSMSIMETFGGTAEKLHYKAESVHTNGGGGGGGGGGT